MSAVMQPRTRVGSALLWFWDLIDISENIRRASDDVISKVDDGFDSLVHAVPMIFLAMVAAVCAWHFDFEATLDGFASLRNTILPGIEAKTADLGGLIVLALTIAPTLGEIFTASYAKANIKIVQMLIIAFTLFDIVTDIPRTMKFMLDNGASFDLLPWGISTIVFWFCFLLWLFMATIGFELLTALFGYAAICYVVKAFLGSGRRNPGKSRGNPGDFFHGGGKGGRAASVE